MSSRSTSFLVFLCLLYSTLQNPVQAEVQLNPDKIEKMDSLLASKVIWAGETPAYSILIDRAGKIVYERHSGFADIGNRVSATRNTVYKLGSITKSYTALAVLQLVEKDQIDLDIKVSQYLEGIGGPAGGVTVRELLTHTSGIPNYTALPEAVPLLSWVVTTRDDIVDLFEDKPLEFEPGTHFSYSNSGYYLLGLIIEVISGQSYFEYLEANVFKPFKLESTYTGEYAEIVPYQAQGYMVLPKGYVNAAPTPQLTPFSAGALDASPADLVRYRRAVFKSAATSEKLRSLITKTGTFPNGVQQRYSLGALNISDFHGHKRWGHSGGIVGFAAHHDYFPEEDLTFVVLVNANGAPISPINLAIKLERIIFSVAEQKKVAVEISRQVLESYVGAYRMSPFRLGSEYERFALNDGVLNLQIGASDENPVLIPLVARSSNEFVPIHDDEQMVRFISKSGGHTKLELVTPDGVLTGYKIPVASP